MRLDPSAFQPLSLPGLEGPVLALADVVFAHTPQRDLALDLYRPAAAGSVRPLVVFIHGGGWHGGDKESYRDLAALVAAHGCLAASVEYRLAGEAPYPASLQDCKLAVRWLRAHADELGADPSRLAAWGHSAGGHLAALVALTAGQLEGEGYAGVPSSLQAVLCFSAPFDLPALQDQLSLDYFRDAGADWQEALRLASPTSHVRPGSPPCFLCHGEQDDLVPADQSRRFAAALAAAGVSVELLLVPEAGHDLERFGQDLLIRALAFLERWLGAAA